MTPIQVPSPCQGPPEPAAPPSGPGSDAANGRTTVRAGRDASRPARRPRWIAGLLAGLAVTAGPALAQDPDDAGSRRWNLSGFGTVGATQQHGAEDWGFMRENGQPGASDDFSVGQDSRAGLQWNWSDRQRWDAFVQGVWRHRPSGTPLGESVEWAYVGYRPTPDSQIRIGRASADTFLYADIRSIGYAQTWARLPVDFYGFLPVGGVDGVHLSQQWQGGDVLWKARAAYGRFGSSSASVFDGSRIRLDGRKTLTFSLAGETDGLLVKASFSRMHMQMDLGPAVDQLRGALAGISQIPVPGVAESLRPLQSGLWTGGVITYVGLGLQYDTGPWTLVAEGSDTHSAEGLAPSRRGYLSLAYHFPRVTVFGLVSRTAAKRKAVGTPDLMTPLAPAIGPEQAMQAQMLAGYASNAVNLYRFDQSTVGAGLRWDLSPQAALKFQVDRFKVHGDGAGHWARGTGRPDRVTLLTLMLDFTWGT